MTATPSSIDDETFLVRFHDLSLDPALFDHRGHLRLAWLVLQRDDVDIAIEKVAGGIRAYAESQGARTKYHATITDAIVRIMARRIDRMGSRNFEAFLVANSDLVDNAFELLCRHFSHPLLLSDAARLGVLEPDLEPI